MFLILLKLLKKYDYNINTKNIKYFLMDLYELDKKQDFLIKSQIENLLEDIDNLKKDEQILRAKNAREL